MNNLELKQFILDASRATYASGDESIKEKQSDGSTSITFSQGSYRFHDNYFGGEPYGGREVVFYQGKPVWIMVYYGQVYGGANGEVYGFLMQALSANTLEMPYRGPAVFVKGVWKYENVLEGGIERFSGTEKIYKNDKLVYVASYIGGVVDQ